MNGNIRRIWSVPALMLAAGVMLVLDMGVAEAVPAFARKYQANCSLCHTNVPRLAPFGQKFLANGYQFPGTEDGDSASKIVLDGQQGPVTLDEISSIMAVRLRGDISRSSFDAVAAGSGLEDTTIDGPTKFNIFIAGTATKNLSYFIEAEDWNTERAFLQFSNLGGKQGAANLKVGIFDPSSLYSFSTHRQQMNPIKPVLANDPAANIVDIQRIPLLPLAFTSKFYGLQDGAGGLILPFAPTLYNAPAQNGIAIHGRPLGDNHGFLYQIGMAHNTDASVNQQQRTDSYAMVRYDFDASGIAAQVSGFYYQAPDAAVLGGTGPTTDINRTGIAARAQWAEFDVYGTYTSDSIDVPAAMAAMWEDTASALSVEGDWRFDANWMVGVRYDQMSAGGMKAAAVDASFLAVIGKYYPSPNIGLFARHHQNLESSTAFGGSYEGQHPATNLRSTTTLGVDMAF